MDLSSEETQGMTRLIVLLAVIFLAGLSTGQTVCDNTTYAQYYFDLCLADSVCSFKLDLHSDELSLFTNLIHNELLSPAHLTPDDMCQENVTHIWIGWISTFPFCQWNQIPDLELGCICREDRLCVAAHPTEFSFNDLGIWLLGLMTLLVIAYSGFSVMKNIRANRKEIEREIEDRTFKVSPQQKSNKQ